MGERRARGLDVGKAVEKYGWSLVNATHWIERLWEEDVLILSITINTPASGREDYLVVVRAAMGGRRMVGFVGGSTLQDAVTSALNKIGNGTVAWKDDQYAK